MSQWTVLTTYGSGLDADIAVATLRGAGIPAESRGNDIVGVVGFGFQGTTARGVDVLVPDDAVANARTLLGLDDDQPA